jgi:acetate---CoA ligase (ADP-forming)
MTDETNIDLSKYYGKVVLKDGSTMIFRPIKKNDVQDWWFFYKRLTAQSDCLRLQRIPQDLTLEDAQRYCSVDYYNQFALVAEVREESQKRIVAVGRYTRKPDPSKAEISFIVLNSYQNKGIGAKLIEWLATAAQNHGIDTFETQVLSDNTALLSVFQSYGFHMHQFLENDIYHITFALNKTPRIIENSLERSSQATLKSLEYILKPRSAAVIGASNRPGAMGQLILQSMLQSGFKGPIYPINANYDTIMSVKAYPSILNAPGDVDLAIIAAPSAQILNIVDECGRKKVKGIIVIADGFREKDEKGAILEREMLDTAFSYGMRIIGPNCMGAINTDPESKLNATFALIKPEAGNISFVSQSGALGLGILEYANNLNIGFSNFISVGNRADIGATDLLQYWEKDPATKVILLYLESFDNPEIFSRVSRRVTRQKPILAIKGGSTPEGSRATRSHTGAMATSGLVSEALLQEAGILTVNSVSELFDVALLLANQPVPRGRNVVVVSSGGGPGILAADAFARNGFKLPELPPDTLVKIKSVLKRELNINNPVDLTASVSAEEFEAVLNILAVDPAYDAILSIYIPPSGGDYSNFENAVGRASNLIRQNGKPLLSSYVGMTHSKGKILEGHLVPYYVFPEEAAPALANAFKYHQLKSQEIGIVPELVGIEREKARQLVNNCLTSSPQRPLWLSSQDIKELFKYYGIRFAETLISETPENTAELAANIGLPVVIKLASATITHKTDVGGVILNVKTREQAQEAFKAIKDNLIKIGRENEMQGVIVQPEISEGIELIVGVTEDRQLGHVFMFGMGGVLAELLKDTSLRLHPLTDAKAKDLINSVKISPLLNGYRGMPPCDTKSLEDLLLRISALVEDIPQISEMDLNPVKVMADHRRYWVIDARIMIK